MRRYHFIHLLAFVSLLALPHFAHAATTSFFGPIIPEACNCPGTAPGWGCVLQVAQNILNALTSFGVIIITLFIAYGGFTLIMSPNSEEARSQAKQRVLNAVIGLFIVLASWLVVDSIMKVLYNSDKFGPWQSILSPQGAGSCLEHREPTNLPGIAGTGNAGGGSGDNGTGLVTVPADGGGTGTSGMNVQSALSYLTSHARPLNQYTGYCGVAVRRAIAAGGLSKFNSGQGNAYQMGGALSSSHFKVVYQGKYSPSSDKGFAYQPGDVTIFQPVPGHANGHITMYTGSQWVSDAIQAHMASNYNDYQGGSFTVYRP